jgi:hypothetical protein
MSTKAILTGICMLALTMSAPAALAGTADVNAPEIVPVPDESPSGGSEPNDDPSISICDHGCNICQNGCDINPVRPIYG